MPSMPQEEPSARRTRTGSEYIDRNGAATQATPFQGCSQLCGSDCGGCGPPGRSRSSNPRSRIALVTVPFSTLQRGSRRQARSSHDGQMLLDRTARDRRDQVSAPPWGGKNSSSPTSETNYHRARTMAKEPVQCTRRPSVSWVGRGRLNSHTRLKPHRFTSHDVGRWGFFVARGLTPAPPARGPSEMRPRHDGAGTGLFRTLNSPADRHRR
jgi:hypothetical protein